MKKIQMLKVGTDEVVSECSYDECSPKLKAILRMSGGKARTESPSGEVLDVRVIDKEQGEMG